MVESRARKDSVAALELDGQIKKINTESGPVIEARTVIIATGASPEKLAVQAKN